MKKTLIMIIALAVATFANCYTYGSDSYSTTNCYENGKRESWTTTRSGSMTTTTYRNSDGTTGRTNQYNYGNGDYNRTYRNNKGYSSTTTKSGNCYRFRDNNGNTRTKCY